MNKSHITLTCSEEKLVAQKNLVFVSDFFFLATFFGKQVEFFKESTGFSILFFEKMFIFCSIFLDYFFYKRAFV